MKTADVWSEHVEWIRSLSVFLGCQMRLVEGCESLEVGRMMVTWPFGRSYSSSSLAVEWRSGQWVRRGWESDVYRSGWTWRCSSDAPLALRPLRKRGPWTDPHTTLPGWTPSIPRGAMTPTSRAHWAAPSTGATSSGSATIPCCWRRSFLHSAGREADFPPLCSPLLAGQTIPSAVRVRSAR